jgi:tetratricopeptide (TPR) repeat protein
LERDELRRRATVVAHFELEWLGVGDAGGDQVEELLLNDCGRVEGPDGVRHWTLYDGVRRAVVARTARSILRATWKAIPVRPEGPEQWAIDQLLINGTLPAIDDLDIEQLRAIEAVSRWARSDHDQELHRRLRLRDFLVPLRAVATDRFIGREALLEQLAHRPEGASTVLIYGFGGVGKSALCARHLLRSMELRDARIAYLNFDHSALDPMQATSLIQALAEQLAWQLDGDATTQAEKIGEAAGERLRTTGRELEVSSREAQVVGVWYSDLLASLSSLTYERPVVIVIDTLEEVQRRPETARHRLMELLGIMGGTFHNAEVVMAGRAPFPEAPVEHIELRGLERNEAILLLQHLAGDRPGLEQVVDVVGTSPLVLRLAAGILARSGDDDELRDLELHRVGIEGALYRRLLEHIPDPAVRRLAHPGLTLRRVTPDLIRNVLARPCRVRVPDDGRARELFTGLAREAMLVEPVPGEPWAVKHRSDVRGMMLTPLAEDEPEVVAQIHRAAIRAYTGDDLVARTEAMYHRLMLGQRERTLDKHWSPEIGGKLAESIDELPPASKAYLAARADLAISPEDVRAAELATRRLLVKREVESLIADGLTNQAADALAAYEADTRDSSPSIAALRVQVLELTGRMEEALDDAETERSAAARRGDTDAFFTFTFHVARLGERVGRPSSALSALDEALSFARGLQPTERHRVTRLQRVFAALAYNRRAGRPLDEELLEEAIALYDGLPLRRVRAQPGLLRDLAAEAGSRSPKILTAALRAVGLGTAGAEPSAVEGDGPLERLERGARGVQVADAIEALGEEAAVEAARSVTPSLEVEADAAVYYEPELTEQANDPDAQPKLADSYDARGGEMLRRGDAVEAERFWRRSLEIRVQLATAHPANVNAQHDLGIAYSRLGELMQQLGDLPQAERLWRQALEISARLATADPANTDAQRHLAIVYSRLGDLALMREDAGQAERLWRDSLAIQLEIRDQLTEADPANIDVQRTLSMSHAKLGELMLQRGDRAEAERCFRDGLAAVGSADESLAQAIRKSLSDLGVAPDGLA